MKAGPAEAAQPSRHPAGASTALVHLYRGELGRLTAYRRRLDTTTNWAISFTGAAVSLMLSNDGFPHTVALLAMSLMLFFVVLEAGRFRQYEMCRARVSLLERGYFPDQLRGDAVWEWVGPLIDHLNHPQPPLDRMTAMGWRLRRNYLWIYLVILIMWLFKLQGFSGSAVDLGALMSRASVGPLPGAIVLAVVAAFYSGLVVLAVRARRRYPQAEDW